MVKGKLTEKQKRFGDEYLIEPNVTHAVKAAGYKVKNDNSAAAQGSRLLRNVNVAEYIRKKQIAREKRTEITQDKVLKELAGMAFDDIKNYLSFWTEKINIGETKMGVPIVAHKPMVEIKDSDKMDTRNISEVQLGKDGQFKFKLYSKKDALELLGKHLGMFSDTIKHVGDGGGPIAHKFDFSDGAVKEAYNKLYGIKESSIEKE